MSTFLFSVGTLMKRSAAVWFVLLCRHSGGAALRDEQSYVRAEARARTDVALNV